MNSSYIQQNYCVDNFYGGDMNTRVSQRILFELANSKKVAATIKDN